MKLHVLKAYCRALPAVQERLLGAPENILVYSVGGHNFAWFKTSSPERWRFSFKVSPERFVELTDQPGVKPARYMARFRWIGIVKVEEFNGAYLRELVRGPHAYAAAVLSARRRRELGL